MEDEKHENYEKKVIFQRNPARLDQKQKKSESLRPREKVSLTMRYSELNRSSPLKEFRQRTGLLGSKKYRGAIIRSLIRK